VHDPDDYVDRGIWRRRRCPRLIELRDQKVVTAIGAGMNQTGRGLETVRPRESDPDMFLLAGSIHVC